jgi:hypothetical protein
MPAPSSSSEGTPDELPLGMPSSGASGSPPAEAPTEARPPVDMSAGTGVEPTAEPPPSPAPVPSDPAQLPPLRVWIAGDSTVANGQTPCPRGWGGAIAARFDERVTINSAAAGGRSVHTWLYQVGQERDDATGECALARDAAGQPLLQQRWQTMLDGISAGDYLIIHNCDRHVGLEAFEAAYAMMAEAAQARGAHPIFVTPVSMVRCNGNTAVGSRGAFVTSTLAVGERLGVPVIDLHARSVALFQSLDFCPIPGGDVSAATTGPVGDFFCDDHTHFSGSGAIEIAGVMAQALREQQIPLAAYLK